MKPPTADYPVTLADVAGRVGASPEHIEGWAGENTIILDWAGRRCIPASLAGELVRRQEAAELEQREASVAAEAEAARRQERIEARTAELVGEAEREIRGDDHSWVRRFIMAGRPEGDRLGLTPSAREKLAEARRDARQRATREVDRVR